MAEDMVMGMIDGMIIGQGTALAASEIVKEVLFHYVSSQPDPRRTLREMHAAISSRMDAHPSGAKSVYGLAREAVDMAFTGLDRRLRAA